jgi:hypothetical protein
MVLNAMLAVALFSSLPECQIPNRFSSWFGLVRASPIHAFRGLTPIPSCDADACHARTLWPVVRGEYS